MKIAVFVLVNLVCFLLVILGWSYMEIGYLESKADYFDKVAEGYRKTLYENYECPSFPWYTLYDKTGKRPPHLFPNFAMNEMDEDFQQN